MSANISQEERGNISLQTPVGAGPTAACSQAHLPTLTQRGKSHLPSKVLPQGTGADWVDISLGRWRLLVSLKVRQTMMLDEILPF